MQNFARATSALVFVPFMILGFVAGAVVSGLAGGWVVWNEYLDWLNDA